MKVLVLDNYDSFTYNLVHYVESFLHKDDVLVVYRNDEVEIKDIVKYDKIILSPGPGLPHKAGKLMQVINEAVKNKITTLGVCLGHQAIAEYFGARLINLEHPYHGVSSKISVIKSSPLYNQIPNSVNVGRYHSWVVDKNNLPNELIIDSLDESGNIMSYHHKKLNVFGVQYHPESILTEFGKQLIFNFLSI
jgi:anthranilate synthase component 2